MTKAEREEEVLGMRKKGEKFNFFRGILSMLVIAGLFGAALIFIAKNVSQ